MTVLRLLIRTASDQNHRRRLRLALANALIGGSLIRNAGSYLRGLALGIQEGVADVNIHLRMEEMIAHRSRCLAFLQRQQLAIQKKAIAVAPLATRLTFRQRLRHLHQLPHLVILVDIEMKSMMMD